MHLFLICLYLDWSHWEHQKLPESGVLAQFWAWLLLWAASAASVCCLRHGQLYSTSLGWWFSRTDWMHFGRGVLEFRYHCFVHLCDIDVNLKISFTVVTCDVTQVTKNELSSPHFLRALPSQFCPSVCLSVRPSVTRADQSKMVQARITNSSPSAAWKTLVSRSVKFFHKF